MRPAPGRNGSLGATWGSRSALSYGKAAKLAGWLDFGGREKQGRMTGWVSLRLQQHLHHSQEWRGHAEWPGLPDIPASQAANELVAA